MHPTNRAPHDGADAGLGMIEVVVAMFMLALVAIAALPLLLNGMQRAAENSALATATQLVNEQLQLARIEPETCASIEAFATRPVGDLPDAGDAVLRVDRDLGDCPDGTTADPFPGTIRLTVTVVDTAGGAETALASASTLLLVRAP